MLGGGSSSARRRTSRRSPTRVSIVTATCC